MNTQLPDDFRLKLDDIEPAKLKISSALPHPLDVLFDDCMDTLDGGGDQDIYNAVGFGIGIIPTVAGDWEITAYDQAILGWHLRNYAATWPGATKAQLHISDVVHAILKAAVTRPGPARRLAAENLRTALTAWATNTYER